MVKEILITHVQGVRQLPPKGVYSPLHYYVEKTYEYATSPNPIVLKETNFHNHCMGGLYHKTAEAMAQSVFSGWAIKLPTAEYLHDSKKELFVDAEGNIWSGLMVDGKLLPGSKEQLYLAGNVNIVSPQSTGLFTVVEAEV